MQNCPIEKDESIFANPPGPGGWSTGPPDVDDVLGDVEAEEETPGEAGVAGPRSSLAISCRIRAS